MSINVVPAEKGKFKVLINFIQEGIDYSSVQLANQQAQIIHSQRPHAELHLATA